MELNWKRKGRLVIALFRMYISLSLSFALSTTSVCLRALPPSPLLVHSGLRRRRRRLRLRLRLRCSRSNNNKHLEEEEEGNA